MDDVSASLVGNRSGCPPSAAARWAARVGPESPATGPAGIATPSSWPRTAVPAISPPVQGDPTTTHPGRAHIRARWPPSSRRWRRARDRRHRPRRRRAVNGGHAGPVRRVRGNRGGHVLDSYPVSAGPVGSVDKARLQRVVDVMQQFLGFPRIQHQLDADERRLRLPNPTCTDSQRELSYSLHTASIQPPRNKQTVQLVRYRRPEIV
jgi:hypothetical protein